MENILNTLSDGIVVVDPGLNVVFANQAFRNMSGLKGSDIIGHRCKDVPQACGILSVSDPCPHEEALAGGYTVMRRVEVMTPEGWSRIIQADAMPVRDEHGSIVRIVASLRDVTDMTKSENILRRYAEGLSILYEISSVFLNSRDIAGAVRNSIRMIGSYYDADLSRVFVPSGDGASIVLMADSLSDEVPGRALIFPSPTEQAGYTFIEKCPAIVNDYDYDKRFTLTPEDQGLGVKACVTVPMVADERIMGVLCLLYKSRQDIGTGELWYLNVIASSLAVYIEKERYIERLGSSEAFLGSVLEGIGEGVIVIDRDYKIISANRNYFSGLKLTAEEVIGNLCHCVSHNSEKPCHENGEICSAKIVFETGRPHSALHTHHGKDGAVIFAQTSAYPMLDSQGRITAVIETVLDVTDKVKLEKDLERRIKELEEFYDMAVGRELRMIELKEEIERLKSGTGKH